jgi:porphobilinogen synthase
MQFPEYRARRLRKNENFRRLIRETKLSVDDLVYPLFAVPGNNFKKPISSMPGQFQQSVDNIAKEAQKARDLGIPAVLLFGIPAKKDAMATGAFAKDGIVQQAIKRIKNEVPDILVITDVCLCEYTSHGHCGILEKDTVLNDETLEVLAESARRLTKTRLRIYPSWLMRQNTPRLFTGLSVKPPRARHSLATEKLIRWIRLMPTKQ